MLSVAEGDGGLCGESSPALSKKRVPPSHTHDRPEVAHHGSRRRLWATIAGGNAHCARMLSQNQQAPPLQSSRCRCPWRMDNNCASRGAYVDKQARRLDVRMNNTSAGDICKANESLLQECLATLQLMQPIKWPCSVVRVLRKSV